MRRVTAAKKIFALVCAGLYLIFGGALGHAFVWCAEPGDQTHLEFNLAGGCAPDCASGPAAGEPGAGHALSVGESCDDYASKTNISTASSRPCDLLPLPALPALAHWQLQADLPATQQTLSSFLHPPERPHGIAHAILRTTVLRH